jgi:replication-associated recombination protein RarA
MANAHGHADWANKYRPAKLEDTILPAAVKESLIRMRDGGGGFGLLLHGPVGCGKTTIGLLMGANPPVRVDCTTQSTKSHIEKVVRDSKSFSLFDDIRVVLMDEADKLVEAAQFVLSAAVEDLLLHNAFVLTTNDHQQIIPQLHSRLKPVDLATMCGDNALREQMLVRAMQILEEEKIRATRTAVASIVRAHFPDMRRTLKELQFHLAVG